MNPIPQKLKEEILADDYYKKCCLTGIINDKIDWHHAWQYAGKQINEKWAIMPIWWRKHAYYGDKDSVHNSLITKEYVQYLSLLRTDISDLKKRMPKKDWEQEFLRLHNKYYNFKYGKQ